MPMPKKIKHHKLMAQSIPNQLVALYGGTEALLAYVEKAMRELEEGEVPIICFDLITTLRSAVTHLGDALTVATNETGQKTPQTEQALRHEEVQMSRELRICERIATDLNRKILETPSGKERDELSASAITMMVCIDEIKSGKLG